MGSEVCLLGCAMVGDSVVTCVHGAFQAMGAAWVLVLDVSREVGSGILWGREVREIPTAWTL